MQKLNRPKKFKKKGFPVLFFLFLLILGTVIVTGAVGWYFYYTGKDRITLVEEKTKSYSKTLAETFALTAEAGFATRNYTALRSIFQQKLEKNTIDEAFFVLLNGRLMAHSNPKIAKELKGYLSNDEFKYNLDYIHLYTKKRSRKAHFLDYYIDGTEAPFNKEEMYYIQKYFYKDINKYYWLVTRAVFSKNRPVGTVAFIISRDRISQYIRKHIDKTIFILKYAMAGVLGLSFFLSLIVFFRYRSLQKKALLFNSVQTVASSGKEKQRQVPVDKQKKVQQDRRSDKQAVKKQQTSSLSSGQNKEKQQPAKTKQAPVYDASQMASSKTGSMTQNEYITIEVLGTIDDNEVEEMLAREKKRQTRHETDDQLTIFDEVSVSNNTAEKNIKDAIPIRKD